MSFRLSTIFYVFALVAAALATFGPAGIVAATFVIGFWTVVFQSSNPRRMLTGLVVAICFLLLVIALLLPAVTRATEAARSLYCSNNLKQIVTALHLYHDSNRTLPPAHVADADGKPILSWRVSILPFIEGKSLYDSMDQSRAWDSPTNRRASSTVLQDFQCPSDYSSFPTTSYFAIVGPQTAWPESRGRSFREMSDGASNTIALIEACGRSVNWAEPRELTFDEAVEMLTRPPDQNDGHLVSHGFFYLPSRGRNVAFCDGYVEFLATPLDRELAKALLTVAGGEAIDLNALRSAIQPQLDYAKCYGFGLFVVLSLLPAAWVKQRGNDGQTAEAKNTVAAQNSAEE